jgi:hypothetical protein
MSAGRDLDKGCTREYDSDGVAGGSVAMTAMKHQGPPRDATAGNRRHARGAMEQKP